MKLLLCKNVNRLGIVGDIVDVSSGYARNFLVPQGLATEPTNVNVRRLAEARRVAEHERAQQRVELEKLAGRLKDVEITIKAKANEAGVLYGSVGKREIAHALHAEGYFVESDQIVLSHAIGQLDNTEIELRLASDLRTSIKLWIVRDKTGEEDAEEETEGEQAESDGDETEN
ncbi:MAG: 50S ribosomal protein L9 [Planctomycetota bacterium]